MRSPFRGGSLRLPNSQPSDEDLRARRCSAIRTSSRCSFSMTASCASSLPTRPAATPAAYCAVTVLAICELTVVGETWREAAHAKIAQSNCREQFTSHAYTECRHVAQCFTLPNFSAARHDDLIRRTGEAVCYANLLRGGNDREGLEDDSVLNRGRQCQETQCKMFFQKAA